MKVEVARIANLIPDPSNARKHDKKNLDAIKGSLAKFGQQKPIVVGKNNVVIAGNGTLEAATALGWTEIDIVRTELEGADAIAFALADNRTAELAIWDDEVLAKQLQSLYEDDYAIADFGFDPGEYDIETEGQSNSGLTDDDDIPDVEDNSLGVKLGDIWELGKHRVMCGDSTVKENIDTLMGGSKADMVYTDPPYGINVNTDWTESRDGYAKGFKNTVSSGKLTYGYKHRKVANDDRILNINFLFGLSECVYMWGGDYFLRHIDQVIYDNSSLLVWDKNGGNESLDATIGASFETCLVWPKRKRNIIYRTWRGMMGKGDGSGFLKDKITLEGDCSLHPTQKPVRLHLQLFETHKLDDRLTVLDPFLGSGSTLIACEKTNRVCYGMELDPHYVSVIIERWQKFTGNQAKLVSKG